MKNAPFVVYSSRVSPALAHVCLVLGGSGWVGIGALWLVEGAAPSNADALLLIAAAACATGAAAVFYLGMRPLDVCWDGEGWTLLDVAGRPLGDGGPPRVALDLQHALLLHWPPHAGRRGRWLWLAASASPARWPLLRAALYFAVPTAGPPLDLAP